MGSEGKVFFTGCVPGVEADVVGVLEEGESGGFGEDPGLPVGRAEGHGAEDYFGDFEAGGAEVRVLHFDVVGIFRVGWQGGHSGIQSER